MTVKKLAFRFVAIAVVAATLGSLLTVHYYDKSGWSEVGKALLTLAITFSVGGAAATWVKVAEQRRDDQAKKDAQIRADQTTWNNILNDVVEVDQMIAVARQLIAAHKTAKTYSEQYAHLVRARLTLRRVWFDPLVANDVRDRTEAQSIQDCLDLMKSYLDNLGEEYEKYYLRVARQQRIDEGYLNRRVSEAAGPSPTQGADYQRELDFADPIYQPTEAWRMLQKI